MDKFKTMEGMSELYKVLTSLTICKTAGDEGKAWANEIMASFASGDVAMAGLKRLLENEK